MQQDVLSADAGKNIEALGQNFRQSGLKCRIGQIGAVNLIRHRHQAHQIDDSRHPVEIVASQFKLLQQKVGHCG